MSILTRFLNSTMRHASATVAKRFLRGAFAGLLVTGLPSLAFAGPSGYGAPMVWNVVTLPESSGAKCGDGSPYRFFVNRTPFSKDMVVFYEGGGACTDYKSCMGKGTLSAVNPDGIPKDYLSTELRAVTGRITPFTDRFGITEKVRTQSGDIVYLPYCTGDVHTGSALRVYKDTDQEKNVRAQHFAGQANIRAAAKWIRENFGRPENLVLTGFSAGSLGSSATYPIMRDALEPTRTSTLLADSALLFSTPDDGSPEDYPSIRNARNVRNQWGQDLPGVGILSRVFGGMQGYTSTNPISAYNALAIKYPNDRFSFIHFMMDGTMSSFNYKPYYPDLNLDQRLQLQKKELDGWRAYIDGLGHRNIDYYFPHFRRFADSHCATIIDFSNTGIEAQGFQSVKHFIENTLNRNMVLLRAVEESNADDYFRKPSPWIALASMLF